MAIKDLKINAAAFNNTESAISSKLQSVELNNSNNAAKAVNTRLKADKLLDELRLNNLTSSTFETIKNPAIVAQGKVEAYSEQAILGSVNKTVIEVPVEIHYTANQEFPVRVDHTITNIVSGGTYKIKSAGLKDRDARIIKLETLSDKGIIDAISYYNFNESSGTIKVILKDISKDISQYHISKLTFRIYYIYTKTDGSIKFINKSTDYKKNYKLYGKYKMKNYTYNLSDVSGKTFIKYNAEHPEELITNPATCNNNITVGIHTTYAANPYDIEQWIEKREIYYIPSDTTNPSINLLSGTTNILGSTSGTAFFKRTGFVQDNSILNNIPYDFQTILIPRSYNNKNTFQETFKTNDVYEADAIRLLRGDIVNEEVFYNRRKRAMEESLIGLMNGQNEMYSLTDEYLTSNGKDRIYNFAKGFSNMINQEALNVKDDIVNKRALQDPNTFTYQVVFEKKAYDGSVIDTINNSTTKKQDEALMNYIQFSPRGSRELIERLADATQYPMNKLYEESFMEKAKRDIALSNKSFAPEKNTHLKYYNLTKPKLNNVIKEEYTKTTFDIARDMLFTGFYNIFFKDLFTFKKLSNSILDSIAKKDTNLPTGNTSVSYKIVFSNSQEETDEITDLIRSIIKPNDGTKLEVYHGE